MESKEQRSALAGILVSRFAYSINWYTTAAPAIYLIARAYGEPLALDGLIASFFFLAVAIFQLPAGAIARIIGSKRTAFTGLMLLSIFSIASPFAPNFEVLLLFRFIAGAGAALYFGPAVGVLSHFFVSGERTGVIGLYNASFQLGAGATLLIWPYLDVKIGWQSAVILGGVICLASALLMRSSVKLKFEGHERSRGSLLQVLRNRKIWFVALGFVGCWGTETAASQYMVQYSEQVLHLHPLYAGLLSSLILFLGIPGGAAAARLERRSGMRRALIATTVAFSLSLLLFTLNTVVAAVAGSMLAGALFTSAVTLTYSLPAKLPEVEPASIPLAVSLVNFLQVLGGFWVPTLFGFMVYRYGFTLTWIAMALISIVFLPFYLTLKI
jgi:MFS family permease